MATNVKQDRRSTSRSGAGAALRTRVELWIAILFMVVAFGAGLTVGVLAQPKEAPVVGIGTGGIQAPGSSLGGVAPPLSDEQLQQGLPSGHPSLTGPTGATGGGGNGGGKDSQDGSTGGGNP